MSDVPAEPPHLVQLEIQRTFSSGGPTRRPSPAPRTRTGQAQARNVIDHALEGRGDRMGHDPERREEAVSPPPNIYLGYKFFPPLPCLLDLTSHAHRETYTANVHLSVPANAALHAAHKVHLVVEMHSGIPPLAPRTASTTPPQPAPQVRQYPLSTHDFERIDPSPRAAEIVVPLEWELKELGSHAVVCLVSYGVQVADRETGELQLVMRSYRKVGGWGCSHDATTPSSERAGKESNRTRVLRPSSGTPFTRTDPPLRSAQPHLGSHQSSCAFGLFLPQHVLLSPRAAETLSRSASPEPLR